MQEKSDEDGDYLVPQLPATFIDPSRQHLSAATDAAVDDHSSSKTTISEESETQNGNKKNGGEGYEGLDPCEVEEARLRAQRPSEYVGLQRDNLEDLYSRPKKKR